MLGRGVGVDNRAGLFVRQREVVHLLVVVLVIDTRSTSEKLLRIGRADPVGDNGGICPV